MPHPYRQSQVLRLRTIAEEDGGRGALADLGAARLAEAEGGSPSDRWVVLRHVQRSDGETVREYLSEAHANGRRDWGPLFNRGGFRGYRDAQSAIAQVGEGVAVRERTLQIPAVVLQDSGQGFEL